jgi:hypothetical protein
MQSEAVTVMPSCSGGGYVVSGVIFIPITVVKFTVVIKGPFLGWRCKALRD